MAVKTKINVPINGTMTVTHPETEIDQIIGLARQNSTVYAVGDIAFCASLPSSLILKCTTAGTTAATEPSFSGATEGATVTDGTVTWTYKDLVSDLSPYLPLSGGTMTGFIKANGLGFLGTRDDGYNTFHAGSASDGTGGAYLQAFGKNHDQNPGVFRLAAMTTNGSPMMLLGKPDGTLKWGTHNVVTDDQLSNYAPKASPAFSGTPTAPTAAHGTATTQIATTAFVKTAVDNASYLHLSGGTMTGFIKSNGFGILGTSDAGSNTFHGGSESNGSGGAYLQAYGKNHDTFPGEFRMAAVQTNGSPYLFRGQPDGTLTWGTHNVVTDDMLSSYLPLSGGTMTGFITANANGLKSSGSNGYVTIHGGSLTNGSEGAYLQVLGKDNTTNPGAFILRATKTDGTGIIFAGRPDGTLKWGTHNVVTDDQLSNYAPKASPAFSGTPTAPTATHGTATTQLATTQFVSTAIGRAGANQIDVVTTGGNYTVPETGLYKITLKGGGAGGSSGGYYGTTTSIGGNGGGEGGTQIVYRVLTKDTVIPVVIGAGGAGGVASTTSGGASRLYGGNGGNTSVTINGTTITANGGVNTGLGGAGMIPGAPGERYIMASGTLDAIGGSGGGNGGGSGTSGNSPGVQGGGGAGGHGQASTSTAGDGAAGGAGYVWFEYHKAAYD